MREINRIFRERKKIVGIVKWTGGKVVREEKDGVFFCVLYEKQVVKASMNEWSSLVGVYTKKACERNGAEE